MNRTALVLSLGKVSGGFVAAVYSAFGLADLWFSLIAFRLGVVEGNPFLALMRQDGLFVPAKLALTGIAALLIGVLYGQSRARMLCWGALLMMATVNVYHVVNLTGRL
jgi:hypothetical protein